MKIWSFILVSVVVASFMGFVASGLSTVLQDEPDGYLAAMAMVTGAFSVTLIMTIDAIFEIKAKLNAKTR